MSSTSDVALGHLRRLLARDPMLRDLLADALPGLGTPGPGVVPAVDVLELSDRHVLLLDLPGVRASQVKVRVEGTRLVVEGTKPAHRPEEARVRSHEREAGAFHRDFLLPPDADVDALRAHLEDGLLRVEVPRLGGGTPRDVPVSEG